MRGYSTDLRERIVQAAKEGMSRKDILKIYKVSMATLKRYLQLERDQGRPAAKAPQPRAVTPRKTIINEELLRSILAQNPGATIKELCHVWYRHEQVWPSIATMWRAVKSITSTQRNARQQSSPPRASTVGSISIGDEKSYH